MEVLDLNSDGRLDFFSPALPEFRLNVGTFQFNNVLSFTNRDFGYDSPGEVADFDNDNDVDVLCVNDYRFSPASARKSLGIFWKIPPPPTPSSQLLFRGIPAVSFPFVFRGAAAAADFDNDGDQDLLVTGNTNDSNYIQGRSLTQLYENNGDGSFNLHPAQFPGMEQSAVSWVDYDSDGDFDLLLSGVTNSNNRSATILYRNDSGAFTDSGLPLPGLIDASMAWGDYDNDGDLDLFLAGTTNLVSGPMRLYRNDNGALTEIPFTAPTTSLRPKAAWINCDNDGYLDLILDERIFLNNGDGTFQQSISAGTGGRMLSVDLSNDAKPDLIIHDHDGFTTVRFNSTPATNTPPSIPTNLVAVASGSSVTFSWSPSLDAQQAGGLSYNLRIGTAPGKSDVLSALANPTNGVRFVAGLGNTGLRTSWTIRNLGVGTYYWTVQAIDHSLAASAFAAEQSITVSNAPPVARRIIPRNITANSAVAAATLRAGPEPRSYYWEYGTTNFSQSTAPQFLAGPAPSEEILVLLPNLLPSTTYQYRLVASNSFGISTSSPRFFTTAAPTSVMTEFAAPSPPLRFTPTCIPVDFDNDGDLDLLTCGVEPLKPFSNRSTTLYLNNSGIFTRSPLAIPTPVLGSPTPVLTAAMDFNNDTQIDLLYSASTTVVLLLSNPDGTFREVQIDGTRSTCVPGDPDSDGDIDLIDPRADPLTGTIFFHNDGLDQLRFASVPSIRGQFAAPGDYDNDGDPDILIWGATNTSGSAIIPSARILRNNDSSLTETPANLPPAWTHAHWADYDNDGDLDILFAGSPTNSPPTAGDTVRLFRNDGPSAFTEVQTGITNGYVSLAQNVDFNADGLLDLLTTHFIDFRASIRLHLNSGNLQFAEQDLGITNVALRASAGFADLDGDRFPDLLLNVAPTNSEIFLLRLFHNNTVRPAPATPPIPSDLAAVIAPTFAKLSWKLAGDSNEHGGLHFNLRIGTTRGGAEIASPMSHHVTGFRRTNDRGNAGQGLVWTIRDLPPGTYYWSVQSINHANLASPFAPESTFTIPVSERPLQIVGTALASRRTHQLFVRGPVRARAELLTSTDLLTWTAAPSYIYLPGTNATVRTSNSETTFYRLRLLDNTPP